MADQSTQSIRINAPPADIIAVIADFDAYPQWSRSIKSARVDEVGADGRAQTVHFVIDAGMIKDDYVLRYVWSEQDAQRMSVRWELVSGSLQKAQHGSYELVAGGPTTKVTYSLTVDLTVPMLGLLKRKAERVIMDTALSELKRRVEAR